MKCQLKVMGGRSFKSDKGEHYVVNGYVKDDGTPDTQTNFGGEPVTIFTTQEGFSKAQLGYKENKPIDVNLNVSGTRARYEVA